MRLALYPTLALAGLMACQPRSNDPVPPSWTVVPYGSPALSGFGEVRFASPQVGWITGGYSSEPGYSPTLLATHDGGATWSRLPTRPLTLSGLFTLSPVTEQLLFAVGVSPTPTGTAGADDRAVYRSTDGGLSWQQRPGLGFGGSFRLHFFDEQQGLSFKNNHIQRTLDGGATWQDVPNPSAGGDLNLLAFPTPGAGYAAGGGITVGIVGGIVGGILASTGTLLKTTNAGATWQALPWDKQYISRLSFLSATLGFAATYPDHHLYQTQDGGQTWQLVNDQVPAVSQGQFVSEQEGYFAEGQTIYYTHDSGHTWQQAYQVTPLANAGAAINSLYLPSSTAGYAVTADGQILKTTR